jgi:hypothetical protein
MPIILLFRILDVYVVDVLCMLMLMLRDGFVCR